MTTEPNNADPAGAQTTDTGVQQTSAPAAADTTTNAGAQPQTSEDSSTSLTAGAKPKEETANEGEGQDGKPSEGEDKANSEEASKQGAPEQYEDFTAPEGVAFNDTVLGKFSEVAKELDLTQEAAQKLIDAVAPAIAERQTAVLSEASKQWKLEAEADKEIGGDKFAANLSTARKALDVYGTPKLVELLNKSRLGEHPEVIRFFYRAGKGISEDSIQTGGLADEPSSRDPAMVLYGKKP